MQAGSLGKVVVLQRRDEQRDSHGAQVTSWSDVAELRCAIIPLTGREVLAAQAYSAQLTHQIVLRYSRRFEQPLDLPKLRLLYGTRVFNIQAAINDEERNRQVTLLVSEGLNDG